MLDRWVVLRDLLVDGWLNPKEPVEEILSRNLEVLNPLERDLIRKMFFNVRRIVGAAEDAQFDFEGQSRTYDDDTAGISTSVYLTWSLILADGSIEHFRLKTGRSGSTAEESALLLSTAQKGETFFDVMAWPGEIEPIQEPESIEETLRAAIQNSPALGEGGLRPGYLCVWCDRSALCGAFPSPGRERIPTNARTINLTKTDLVDLSVCERRVAWRRVHGIPYDDGFDPATTGMLSQGRAFHEMIAAAHLSEDPEGAVEAYLLTISPSEVADMQQMWENHQRLLADEALVIRRTEFPVGVTLVDGPNQDMNGATLLGFLDLTVRDRNDIPAIVEIKTGGPGESQLEDDLYAVGARPLIPDQYPVVIHRHYVRSSPPVCEISEYSSTDIDGAVQRLRRHIKPALAWNWEDPLQVPYNVGGWCQGCRHETTCTLYRSSPVSPPPSL